jgi:hypothetical protein
MTQLRKIKLWSTVSIATASTFSDFSPSPYHMTDFKGAVPQDVKAHVFVRGASKAKIRVESNSYLFVLL